MPNVQETFLILPKRSPGLFETRPHLLKDHDQAITKMLVLYNVRSRPTPKRLTFFNRAMMNKVPLKKKYFTLPASHLSPPPPHTHTYTHTRIYLCCLRLIYPSHPPPHTHIYLYCLHLIYPSPLTYTYTACVSSIPLHIPTQPSSH